MISLEVKIPFRAPSPPQVLSLTYGRRYLHSVSPPWPLWWLWFPAGQNCSKWCNYLMIIILLKLIIHFTININPKFAFKTRFLYRVITNIYWGLFHEITWVQKRQRTKYIAVWFTKQTLIVYLYSSKWRSSQNALYSPWHISF